MKIEPIEIPLLTDRYKLGWEWQAQMGKLKKKNEEKNCGRIEELEKYISWQTNTKLGWEWQARIGKLKKESMGEI